MSDQEKEKQSKGQEQSSSAQSENPSAPAVDRDALREEYERLKARVRELEQQLAQTEVGPVATSEAALENILGRLLRQTAMIVQAEKCVIMVYNRETGELEGKLPAFGIPEEKVKAFKVRATEGVSGEVFRTEEPQIFNDAISDSRTIKDYVALLGVRNGITVPLTVETKDEDMKVIARETIGVVHVFNKRRGGQFTREDLRLLRIMARSIGAVIANARLYIDLTKKVEELEETIEALMAGIVMISADGTVKLVNRAARHMLGISPSADVVGSNYRDVITESQVADLVGDTLVNKRETHKEITLDEGKKIFHVQTVPISDNGVLTGVVAILSDITEYKNLERMRTGFIATVSQELRMPLASILGFTRTLLEDKEGFYDPQIQQEFLQIIDSECTRLHRLVNDLASASRIEEGRELEIHARPVNVAELVERVLQTQRTYAKNHTLVADLSEELCAAPLVADEEKLDQILTNLVNNAIKYSPNGGEVRVKGWLEADHAHFSVIDHGVGIPKERQPHVFEKFHRAAGDESAGTGIGLYIVKHMVEAHGGEVWFDTVPGSGTTFHFTIPLRPNPPEKSSGARP